MKVKAKELQPKVKENCGVEFKMQDEFDEVKFVKDKAQDFLEFDEVYQQYRKGVASVAEFCGRVDMLKASGLSPSEAKEAAFVLKAMQEEGQSKTQNRIL